VTAGVDRLLTAGELAELLGVPTRWIRENTRSGAIPHIALGRYRRYAWTDVAEWLEQQKRGGAATTFRKHVQVPRRGTE
jgi:excisionase family DNA binding protein